MSTFFTWETLLTVSGAAAATAYIVQFLKKFAPFKKLNSQLIAFIVAFIVMGAAMFFTGTLTSSNAAMLPISAIIVCFAANGAYDSVDKSITATTKSVESVVNEITATVSSALETIKKSIESIGNKKVDIADTADTADTTVNTGVTDITEASTVVSTDTTTTDTAKTTV